MRELVRAGHARRRVRPQHRPVLRARASSRRPRRSSSWRRSPGRWAASTSRTCETRRPACSTACARRSRSASRAACRRRSRITRSSATATGARASTRSRLVDEARARGVDVTIDQYPYTASSTGISALLPAVGARGRSAEVVRRAEGPGPAREDQGCDRRDPQVRPRRRRPEERRRSRRAGGIRRWPARTSPTITRERGAEPTLENAAETTMWIVEQGGARASSTPSTRSDLVRILAHPATMIASDGEVPIFGQAAPHPRSYGTFARVLGGLRAREGRAHARGRGAQHDVVPGPAARPAGPRHPAARDEGRHRGVRPGDGRDTATFDKPHQYAEGFSHVIVNGQVIFENGAMTAARPGRMLYGPGRGKQGDSAIVRSGDSGDPAKRESCEVEAARASVPCSWQAVLLCAMIGTADSGPAVGPRASASWMPSSSARPARRPRTGCAARR